MCVCVFRNGLKEDVRACLYESVNMWMEEIGPTNKFHGGVEPDLADLVSRSSSSSISSTSEERKNLFFHV